MTDPDLPPPIPPPIPVAPSTPPAPPTRRQSSELPARPTAWPGVVGVISIVFGSLGVLAGLLGIVTPFFGDAMYVGMTPEVAAAQAQAAQRILPWSVSLAVLAGVLGVWLIVGGVGLTRRRASSRRTLQRWAIAKGVLVVGYVVVSYIGQVDQFRVMQQQPGGAAPFPGGSVELIAALGALFYLLWGWALPGFMLVWFGRAKIRAEVDGWRRAA